MLTFSRDVKLKSKIRDGVVHLVNTQVQHKEEMHGNYNEQECRDAGIVETQLACEMAKIFTRPNDED